MTVSRYRPPGVLPLELWDVLVDGQPLYLLHERELPAALLHVVLQLRAGTAQRRRAETSLPRLAIDSVMLAGGGPTAQAAEALSRAGLYAAVVPEPVWIAEPGGRALLQQQHGPIAGAVMEVGQTSIKYSDAAGRVRAPRSLDALPLELDGRALDQNQLRAKTIRFLASVPLTRTRPSALVLALPCEVDDSLRVAGCSYSWPAGDPHLIEELLSSAQLDDVPTWVLNDAELAAISVDLLREPSSATLVLTLGLGLGGAYLAAR